MDELSERTKDEPVSVDDRWGRAARTIGVMVDGLVEFYYEYVVDLRFAPWPIAIDTEETNTDSGQADSPVSLSSFNQNLQSLNGSTAPATYWNKNQCQNSLQLLLHTNSILRHILLSTVKKRSDNILGATPCTERVHLSVRNPPPPREAESVRLRGPDRMPECVLRPENRISDTTDG